MAPERHRPIAIESGGGIHDNRKRIHGRKPVIPYGEKVGHGDFDRRPLLVVPVESEHASPSIPFPIGFRGHPNMFNYTRSVYIHDGDG